MSDTSQENYTTLRNDEWEHIARLKDELTKQRDSLANAYRRYESGDQSKELDPARILTNLRETLRRSIPDIASSAPLTDFSIDDLIAGYWPTVRERKNTATTGFSSLNEALGGGLESGRLVCALGAPNCGKTTFVNQLADYVADSGRPVLYVTCEDTPAVLFAKTLARVGGIKYNAVLKGYPTEEERISEALRKQAGRTSTRTLRYIDAIDGTLLLEQIREKAEAHFSKFQDAGPGVLVVDYLQALALAIKTRLQLKKDLREVVTDVAKFLRAIAVSLGCTVVAITAQNRNNYKRGESGGMASAKESGDIEYTADVMLSLVEDTDPRRVTPIDQIALNLYLDKNRQGQKGRAIALNFHPDRQQFTEVEK